MLTSSFKEKERSLFFLCCWYLGRRRVAMLLLLRLAFVVFVLGSYTINKGLQRLVILWRVVGLKGTVQLERGVQDGRHGYMATVYEEGGTSRTIFYLFSGVTEELKAFFNDISQTSKKQEPRLSYVEGAQDVAVLEAMLESGARNGAVVPVAKF